MSHLKIGEVAPDFTLPASGAKKIHLHSLKDKYVILYFYPKDDTPGCTIEARDFSKLKDEFNNHDAVIIGISKDDLASHQKFQEKYCLEFDLVSDNEEICEQYGVWGERSIFGKKYMGVARTTFLIGKDSKIAHIWENVNVSNHASNVLGTLKSLTT